MVCYLLWSYSYFHNWEKKKKKIDKKDAMVSQFKFRFWIYVMSSHAHN